LSPHTLASHVSTPPYRRARFTGVCPAVPRRATQKDSRMTPAPPRATLTRDCTFDADDWAILAQHRSSAGPTAS